MGLGFAGHPEPTFRRRDSLMKKFRSLIFSVLLLSTPVLAAATKPVQVFILAGQSNMEGQAVVDLEGKNYNDGRGTLAQLLRDPEKAQLVKHLQQDEGKWTVRDDVWCRYKREHGPLLAGPLSVGFAVYG